MIERIGPVPDFVARVTGVDLRKPLDDETFATIQDAFHRYAVLVLPDQDIDDDQQIAFSERFGPLERALSYDQYGGVRRPEISRLSNVEEDGTIMKRDCDKAVYHRGTSLALGQLVQAGSRERINLRDARRRSVRIPSSPMPVRPMTLGRDPGGATQKPTWTVSSRSIPLSTAAALSWATSSMTRPRRMTVRQTFVRTHPDTGRKMFYGQSLLAHPWLAGRGGQALINELTHWNTQRRFVYAHKWQPHDLLMWDNRSVFHRGTLG